MTATVEKRGPRRWRALALVVLVAATYGNGLHGGFQYDDDHSIVRNPHIRSLRNVPRFFVDPATFSGDPGKAMYRPLLLTSLALNHAVHGGRPLGYHAVNIVLHALAVLCLWRLGASLAGATAGFTAAAIFAVHPITTEPVDYVSGRSELLVSLFFLAALWAHVAAWRRQVSGARLAALAACALALLSKATAVALAPALLALDVLVLGWRPSTWGDAWRRHGAYWLLTGLYLVTISANGFLGGSLAVPVRGLAAQVFTQLKAPAYYLSLLAVPHPLSVEHAFGETAALSAAVACGAFVVLSLAWVVWRARRWPVPAWGLVAGALVLLPTAAVPLNMLVNERRLYLVTAAGALVVAAIVSRWRPAPAVLAVAVLAVLTVQRNRVWASPVALWESARQAGSRSYRTWVNLGKAYQEAGRREAARRAYERALSMDARHGDAYNNLGVLLHQAGRLEAAVAAYEEALRRDPEMEEIHANLADAYLRLGQPRRALAVFRQAVALDSTDGAAWNNLGQVLMRLGDPEAARAAFARAARLLPDRHEPYNNLGNALDALGRRRAAATAYGQALQHARSAVDRAAVHANLGETLRRLGDAAAAVHLDSAIALHPTAAAYDFRGRLAWDRGQVGAARAAWQQAVDLDPGRGSAWTGLGEAALRAGDLAAARSALERAVAVGAGARARRRLAELPPPAATDSVAAAAAGGEVR